MWRSVSVTCAIAVLAIAGRPGLGSERAQAAAPGKALAVLVDTSQAMQPHVNHVRAALRQFVAQMQPTHEIALVEFGERPTVLTDYTNDPVRLQKGVERVFARSGTGAHVLDAIVEASKTLPHP